MAMKPNYNFEKRQKKLARGGDKPAGDPAPTPPKPAP